MNVHISNATPAYYSCIQTHSINEKEFMMTNFRTGMINQFVRLLCAAVIMLNPFVALGQDALIYDHQNRVIVVHDQLSPEQMSQVLQHLTVPVDGNPSDVQSAGPSLATTPIVPEKQKTLPQWHIIHRGVSQMNYDDLIQLTAHAVVHNVGTLVCDVPALSPSYRFSNLTNYAMLQFCAQGSEHASKHLTDHPLVLDIVNNNGTVLSDFSVRSYYTSPFFASEDPITITGYIRSLGSIHTFVETTPQNRPIFWHQSQQAGGNIVIHGDHTPMVFKEGSLLAQHKIQYMGDTLHQGADCIWSAQGGMHIQGGNPSANALKQFDFKGVLEAPYVKINTQAFDPRGTINAENIDITAQHGTKKPDGSMRSVHFNHLTITDRVVNFFVRSKGTLSLDFAQNSEHPFRVKGLFHATGRCIIAERPIHGQNIVLQAADQDLNDASRVLIASDLSAKDIISLSSGSVMFQNTPRVVARSMRIHQHQGGILHIIAQARLKLAEQLDLIAPQAKIQLDGKLSGRNLHMVAGSAHINSDCRFTNGGITQPAFAGFQNIHIESKGSIESALPISGKILKAKGSYVYTHGLAVKAFHIEALLCAARDAVIRMEEPSVIDADMLQFSHMQFQSQGNAQLTFKGGHHHFDSVTAPHGMWVQNNQTSVFTGSNHVGTVHTSGVTTLDHHGSLLAQNIHPQPTQQALYFFGKLALQKMAIDLKAPKLLIHDLQQANGKAFDHMQLSGDAGVVSGILHAKTTHFDFKKSLHLTHAHFMNEVLSLCAPLIVSTKTTMNAKQVHIQNDDQTAGSDASAVTLVMNQTSMIAQDVEIHTQKADLSGLSLEGHAKEKGYFNLTQDSAAQEKPHAQTFTLHGQEATLNPDQIHVQQAAIALKRYAGGLSGAIRLAHDLKHADRVHLQALDYDLWLKDPTQWRAHFTLAVQTARVDGALASPGDLGIATLQGTKVSAPISGQNLCLTAESGDILFYQALLSAIKNLDIHAYEGDVSMKDTKAQAGSDIHVTGSNVLLQSLAQRQGTSSNYQDQKKETSLRAGGNLVVEAKDTLHQVSVVTHSGGNTHFQAGANIIDEALPLERQRMSYHKDGYTRDRYIHQDVSRHTAGGTYTAQAGQNQHLFAPHISAQKVGILAKGDVHLNNVHDIHEHEFYSQEDGGFFGSSETVHAQSYKARSKGARIDSALPAEIQSHCGDIRLTHVNVQAPRLVLKAMQGIVRLLHGTNESRSFCKTESKDCVWQSQEMVMAHHRTYSPSTFSGDVEIWSKDTYVDCVRGHTLDYLGKIVQHQGKISMRWLSEVHDIQTHEVSGLAAPAALVIALAVSLATSFTASGFGATMASGFSGATAACVSGMSQAAFMGVCSQSAVALINHQGHIGKAAQQLTSKHALKSLGLSIVSAGITQGLGYNLGIDVHRASGTLTQHLQAETLKAGVGAGLSLATGDKVEDVLQTAVRSVAAGTLGRCGANKIGALYGAESLDPLSHKFAHAALGAATGALMGGTACVVSGAVGAVVSELSADILSPGKPIDQIKEKEQALGRKLTRQEFFELYPAVHQNYFEDVRNVHKASKIIAAIGASFIGG
ncbi:MAG: DUF637 domain-containing protein, partial [Alphaproteobacteria bacterium]|nr:DUF637 domain-containing protein [Alphaproteobacteria bacterium]